AHPRRCAGARQRDRALAQVGGLPRRLAGGAPAVSGGWRRFVLRLWNALRPQRAERDLERELRAHLTLFEDEQLRRGLSPDAARRVARLALGGVEQAKERHRDARSFPWIDDARRDVAHALRSFTRDRVFTLTAVVSLAVGIGANGAVFTVANALLF